jgi:hypothetical protein
MQPVVDRVIEKLEKISPKDCAARVQKNFSEEIMVNNYERVLQELIDSWKRPSTKSLNKRGLLGKKFARSISKLVTGQTKEWHPHLHMFALLDDWIDQEELSQYWHSITGDSMIVDIRKVKKEKSLGYSKAAAEVCKYALKFGDLSVENTWEAFKVLKGKRLSGAFGSLYGVKIPENLADDMPDEKDLPYLEMLYKFVFGKNSYYDLASTNL